MCIFQMIWNLLGMSLHYVVYNRKSVRKIIFYLCICLHGYSHVYAGASRGQKKGLYPLEWKIEAIVSCLASVLQTELWFFTKISNALSC